MKKLIEEQPTLTAPMEKKELLVYLAAAREAIRKEQTYALRFRFDATNNEAEYEALIAALRIAKKMGVKTLQTYVDSRLVANQINGSYIAKESGKKEQAAIREARSKAKMEKYYNSKVRNTSFKSGDLVYRSNDTSHIEDGVKLGPKWEGLYEVTEGLYEVTEALGRGAYKLKDRNRKLLPRTWNVRNLKKCYVHEM
ncbi:reverse transcriptase domain-containing protein [Tanacetum coccineum]